MGMPSGAPPRPASARKIKRTNAISDSDGNIMPPALPFPKSSRLQSPEGPLFMQSQVPSQEAPAPYVTAEVVPSLPEVQAVKINPSPQAEGGGSRAQPSIPLSEYGSLTQTSTDAAMTNSPGRTTFAKTPEYLRRKDAARLAAEEAARSRYAVEQMLAQAKAAEEQHRAALMAMNEYGPNDRAQQPTRDRGLERLQDAYAAMVDDSSSQASSAMRLRRPTTPLAWQEAANSTRTWGNLNDHLDSLEPAESVADGAAAKHPALARTEAARKVVGNHEALLKDLTRADGPPSTQPALARMPGREKDVDLFLKEIARRLAGRYPDQGCRHTKPTSAQQLETWAAAAAYLAARLQVSTEDVKGVRGHTGRKPDMSPPAGLALRAVLAEVAVEEVDSLAGTTWGKLTDALNDATDAAADGAAAQHGPSARREAARKLISNHQAVCNDLTRDDGPPTTQSSLVRLPGRERDVDLFLKEVARRLTGRPHTRPDSSFQADAWAEASAYLDARLHVAQEEVAYTPGHTERRPDMSPAAGAAFRAVLAEVGAEEGRAAGGWMARLGKAPGASSVPPGRRRRERRPTGEADVRVDMPPSPALISQEDLSGDRSFKRRPSQMLELADSLERWRVEKLGLQMQMSGPPSEAGSEGGMLRSSSRSPSFKSAKEKIQAVRDCTTEEMVHAVAWTTCVLFAIGALVLFVLWATMPAARTGAFVGTFFVCAIAALCYYAKATHMGDVHINGADVPMARYIDWLTTTPLLMYELCHLAHADMQTTMMLVGCDILMISAGIYSACLDRYQHTRQMAWWFGASCIFYVIMLWIINVRIDVSDEGEDTQALFRKLKLLTSCVWTFYPLVVLLGRAQCHLISQNTEDVLLCLLDLISKLGVEGLIVAYAGFVMDTSSSGSSSD